MSIPFPIWQGAHGAQRIRHSIKKAFGIPGCPLVAFFLLILIVFLPLCGNCAELRPYVLPSEKRTLYQHSYDAPVQKPAPENFDYEAFGAKAAALPQAERVKLRDGLRERLERARALKNNTEAAHYAKLLEIIDNIR